MMRDVRTLGGLLETRAAVAPDRPFVTFESGSVTFGEIDRAANRVANALAGLGLQPGDRAAAMLSNRPEYLATWFGMTKAGVIEVPLNTGLRGDLLAYMLAHSGAKLLVIEERWVDRLEAIRAGLPELEHVVVVGDGPLTLDQLLEAPDTPPGIEVSPYDPSVILFTSGTTGRSKGALLTHNANIRGAVNTCDLMGYAAGETFFNAFPLFHINARYTTVVPALVLDDARAVLHDRFTASGFWDIVRAEGITAFNFMGALVMMLFKQPERPDDADNPARVAYGAPAPVAVLEPFEERFGVKLIEVFGSTELCACVQNTVEERKIGSCGRAAPDCIVEIHDEHGRRVPPGVEGEFVVRPLETHIIVEEYWGDPAATAEAFRGIWFHTGDRGKQDEDGWFTFVDRLKDAIRRRGENISSWEVEQVLNDNEAVEETAVVGVPSELTEEEVLAVVKLKPGYELTPEGLLDFAQDRLPHFAVPRYVRFVDELPKNHAQRIQKPVLREQGVEDAWDREDVGYVVRR